MVQAGPMLRQLLVGTAVSVCNIAIHALVMALVVQISSRVARAKHAVQQSLRLTTVMVATVSIATVPVLMAAHFSEVMVWSLAYAIVDAAPAGADPVYFAFVNYTTLGYGDVTPVERWRLLGPMTAMNGVLLFWLVDRRHNRGAAENCESRRLKAVPRAEF
jgi:Ion channel